MGRIAKFLGMAREPVVAPHPAVAERIRYAVERLRKLTGEEWWPDDFLRGSEHATFTCVHLCNSAPVITLQEVSDESDDYIRLVSDGHHQSAMQAPVEGERWACSTGAWLPICRAKEDDVED